MLLAHYDVTVIHYTALSTYLGWLKQRDKLTRPYNELQWRHNGRDNVSNHQPHHCLLNRLFRRRSKKPTKLRVAGLCAGISPATGEFPAQMPSNTKNVSIACRHHGIYVIPFATIWIIVIINVITAKIESILQVRSPGKEAYLCITFPDGIFSTASIRHVSLFSYWATVVNHHTLPTRWALRISK